MEAVNMETKIITRRGRPKLPPELKNLEKRVYVNAEQSEFLDSLPNTSEFIRALIVQSKDFNDWRTTRTSTLEEP